MNNTPKKSGRPKLPPERKKKRYDVFLIESEAELLKAKYGDLSLALRMHLINESQVNTEAIETIKQIKSLIDKY
jgi:hypothetical protein